MLHRRIHNQADSESGQALVEFALVVPWLLLLLLGISDFARAYEKWNEQTSYANTAARYLAVGQPYTNAGTLPTGACVVVSFPNAGKSGAGDPVKVDVRSDYSYIPFVSNKVGIPGTTTLTGSATTRLETTISAPVTPPCP